MLPLDQANVLVSCGESTKKSGIKNTLQKACSHPPEMLTDHFYSINYVVTILESACGQETKRHIFWKGMTQAFLNSNFVSIHPGGSYENDFKHFQVSTNQKPWLPSWNKVDDYKITFLKKLKMQMASEIHKLSCYSCLIRRNVVFGKENMNPNWACMLSIYLATCMLNIL